MPSQASNQLDLSGEITLILYKNYLYVCFVILKYVIFGKENKIFNILGKKTIWEQAKILPRK